MSIVTKTGDRGETSLYSGERVKKSDRRINLLGLLDELNAYIGLWRSKGADKCIKNLEEIQNDLFEMGALVADSKTQGDMKKALGELEEYLSELENRLPPLQNFILPGGHELAAEAHVARTICRRVERALSEVQNLPEATLPYINRLADYLFLAARLCNFEMETKEVIWKKNR